MVGKGRLELPRFSAHDPKSCSSTNFDTSPLAFSREAAGTEQSGGLPGWMKSYHGWAATSIPGCCPKGIRQSHLVLSFRAGPSSCLKLPDPATDGYQQREQCHYQGDNRNQEVTGAAGRTYGSLHAGLARQALYALLALLTDIALGTQFSPCSGIAPGSESSCFAPFPLNAGNSCPSRHARHARHSCPSRHASAPGHPPSAHSSWLARRADIPPGTANYGRNGSGTGSRGCCCPRCVRRAAGWRRCIGRRSSGRVYIKIPIVAPRTPCQSLPSRYAPHLESYRLSGEGGTGCRRVYLNQELAGCVHIAVVHLGAVDKSRYQRSLRSQSIVDVGRAEDSMRYLSLGRHHRRNTD